MSVKSLVQGSYISIPRKTTPNIKQILRTFKLQISTLNLRLKTLSETVQSKNNRLCAIHIYYYLGYSYKCSQFFNFFNFYEYILK